MLLTTRRRSPSLSGRLLASVLPPSGLHVLHSSPRLLSSHVLCFRWSHQGFMFVTVLLNSLHNQYTLNEGIIISCLYLNTEEGFTNIRSISGQFHSDITLISDQSGDLKQQAIQVCYKWDQNKQNHSELTTTPQVISGE